MDDSAVGSTDGMLAGVDAIDGGTVMVDAATDLASGSADASVKDSTERTDGKTGDAMEPQRDSTDGRAEAVTRDAGGEAGDPIQCGFTMPNPTSANLPHPAAYTIEAGTVLDLTTGLMWEQAVNVPGRPDSLGCTTDIRGALLCPLRYATAYCENSYLGGFSDWRLPELLELYSITDFTVVYPSIDQSVFPDTPWESFWSATRLAGEKDDAWYVSFGSGVYHGAFIDEPRRVRCVRTHTRSPARCYPSTSRFSVSDHQVTDAATGLVWQQDAAQLTVAPLGNAFQVAKSYCESLGGGSRLPSVKELLTLLDLTKNPSQSDMLDRTVFGKTSEFYWSSTEPKEEFASVWTIDFGDGSIGLADYYNMVAQTRCVR